MTETPWRERIELGLKFTDELGPHWVALDGEDFLERIELAGLLTLEFAEEWAAIFCYCARGERPVSIAEVAVALKLDRNVVARCLVRLDEEKLLEASAQAGTYVLAPGRRVSAVQSQQPSASR
jgi:hypothetical protein